MKWTRIAAAAVALVGFGLLFPEKAQELVARAADLLSDVMTRIGEAVADAIHLVMR